MVEKDDNSDNILVIRMLAHSTRIGRVLRQESDKQSAEPCNIRTIGTLADCDTGPSDAKPGLGLTPLSHEL